LSVLLTKKQLVVNLAISAEEIAMHYRGDIRHVIARTQDGRRVQFPANILRSVLQRDGIYGTFCISYDDQGRFRSIQALSR
jgi:hypothetical protein